MSAPVRERSKPFGIERSRPSASTLRGAETATSIDGVVLEDAAARHVAALRLALAPGGDLHQHGDLARLAQPADEAPPGVLGIGPVGLGRGEDRHLLVEPGHAARSSCKLGR